LVLRSFGFLNILGVTIFASFGDFVNINSLEKYL